jgi:hypothetical protein
MKNGAAIFFLLLMVSIQTPMGQFLKLPLLIEHFTKHRKQDNLSFYGFLSDHYAPGHNDADLPEDEQLPFKSLTFYSIANAIVTPTIHANVAIEAKPAKKIASLYTYTAQQHLACIFHPPRDSRNLISL